MSERLFSPFWYRVSSLRPRLHSHVRVHRHVYRDRRWYVLENSASQQQHRFTPAAHYLISLMDGDRTTAELAAQFSVHTSQVTSWKRQLLMGVPELFADGRRRPKDDTSAGEDELYEQIGRLKMEVEWLKKKAAELT